MLLLVPQSGTNTRAQIQQKSLELHDRMTDAIDDIVTLTHYDNRHIPTGLREKTRYGTAQVREIRNINAK